MNDLMRMQQEERVRELSQALCMLVECQEEEYRSLALDIHDAVGQSLTSVLLRIKILQEEGQIQRLQEGMAELEEIVKNSLTEVRRISRVLRPAVLETRGLIPALENLCESSQQHTGIRCHFSYNGGRTHFSRNEELLVYRILQEALTNAFLHGRAKNAHIIASCLESAFVLSIRDDGCGFEVDKVRRGIGLNGMNERAGMMGGRLLIRSKEGKGTHILLHCKYKGRKTER